MSLLRIISACILTICAPTGIISNVIVLMAFKRQNNDDYSHIFLVHLAIVDLILCTGGLVTSLGVSQIGGFFFCKGGLLIIALFYCLSSGTLCLMTYDRFIYISTPMKYYRTMTPKRAKVLLAALWALSVINVLPVLTNSAFLRSRGAYYELDIKNCIIPKIINIPYFFWLETVFLMFLLMTIVYNFRILSVARKQSRKIEAVTIPPNTFNTSSVNNETSAILTHLNQASTCKELHRAVRKKGKFAQFCHHAKQRKCIKTILLIVIVHCICNLPYFVLIAAEIFYGYFDYKKVKYVYLLYLLNYLNSVVNPFIYTSLNSNLRRSVKKTLRSICRRA